jgi:hypothetical protein
LNGCRRRFGRIQAGLRDGARGREVWRENERASGRANATSGKFGRGIEWALAKICLTYIWPRDRVAVAEDIFFS